MNEIPDLTVATGASFHPEAGAAVAELASQLGRLTPETTVLFFASSRYDLDVLAHALREHFADQAVLGCTTAGELIGGQGYAEGGLVGAALTSPLLKAHAALIDNLSQYADSQAETLAADLAGRLQRSDRLDPQRQFGLLLIDGLAMREEAVAASLFDRFGGVQIIGGSAGDDLHFERTHVFHEGCFHSDSALFSLFECDLPFQLFRFQHFEPTDVRMVITESSPSLRVVNEINGMPATEAYAEAVGVAPEALDAAIFAANPVMLRVGGEWYVRSIQKANPDGSLSFYCAIDTGLVLTLGKGGDLVENIAQSMEKLQTMLPDLRFVLGCDCIFRRLELAQQGRLDAAGPSLASVPFLGFSTYGEQFNGLHINQTLTGVAIGAGPR